MGYAGGTTAYPTYSNIGDHTETVQIDYDPSVISYGELLRVFWESHNPFDQTWITQYQNIVFYHSEEQRRAIEQSKSELEKNGGKHIQTRVAPYAGFYIAENYHQKYYLTYQNETYLGSESVTKKLLLMKEFKAMYPDVRDLTNSTAAARVNGFLGGNGSPDLLRQELRMYGLSPDGEKALLYLTGVEKTD